MEAKDSSKIRIVCPSPTIQLMPSSNNLAPIEKAVQIWDPLEFHGLVNKVACGKYLAFSTWAKSVVGLV